MIFSQRRVSFEKKNIKMDEKWGWPFSIRECVPGYAS